MDPQSTLRPTPELKERRALSERRFLPRTPRGGGWAPGFTTVSFVAVAGFSMLVFLLLANLLVVQYGRGAVRVALDEGARHGARLGVDAARCEVRVRRVLAGLLGGEMGSGVSYRCVKGPARTQARASVRFPAWLPGVPDFRFEMAATATSERP